MLKIYKTSRDSIVYPKKPGPNTWIDLNSPTEEELDFLKPFIEIPEDVLSSIKDIDEVPKLEKIDGANFILIQTPRITSEEEQEETVSGDYSITPLGIIYNADILITLSEGKNDVMNYLKNKLKNFEKNQLIDTSNIPQLILKILLFNSKIYLRYLKIINQKIRLVQNNLEQSPENEKIIHLMDLEKSLVYFGTSIHSNHVVLEKLGKRKFFTGTEDDEELFEDIFDENKQAIETVKIYGRIVSNVSNTFASIISNNLNRTMKFLTSVTLILMLPTLVASVYGMNVPLPFQESPHAFLIVMVFSIALSLSVIFFFLRKKLF